MSGKGGARHTPKPQLDAGVLQTMFGKHQDLIKDLGKYERISKNQASDPKGLLHCLPLIKGLIKLEPTCEIHGSSLGQGLFQLLVAEPALNDTPWNGSVWLGMKVERVTSLLYHMRRLKGSQSEMATCAAKVTGGEYMQLQEVVKLIKKKMLKGGKAQGS